MRGSDYAEMAAFAAVVDRGSFAMAAKYLRIAPSSLSQTIKRLEERLGVALLYRTTRSVSMTPAGVRLYKRFKPAMTEIESAVIDLHESNVTAAGLVRLHMPRAAYLSLIDGRIGSLHRSYPDIHLEIVMDDALIDLTRSGFDLDIRLAGALDTAATAVKIGGPVRHVAVASSAYLAEHGRPQRPSDLVRHRCIQWRRPNTEHAYRWVFQIDGSATPVDVHGPLTVSHCDVAVAAAIEGVGVAFVLEQYAQEALCAGTVEPILAPFLPVFPGWVACHPRGSRISAAVQALLQFLSEAPDPDNLA
jgi:DNA-binding transcriptional LysR family regulator